MNVVSLSSTDVKTLRNFSVITNSPVRIVMSAGGSGVMLTSITNLLDIVNSITEYIQSGTLSIEPKDLISLRDELKRGASVKRA